MSLFRSEALRHRRGEWLGGIQLSQPLPLRWITAGVVVAVVALVLFLCWGQASRRVRVDGVLLPAQGLVRLVPPQVARVQSVAVEEGQQVKAGQLLMTLSVDDPRLGGPALDHLQQTFSARLESLKASRAQMEALAQDQRQSLQSRLQALAQEQRELDAQRKWHQQRLALAQQSLDRLKSLEAQHFISLAQVQAQQETVLGLQADGAALERQRQSLVRDQAEVEGSLRELPLTTQSHLEELARARDEVGELVARADPKTSDRVLPVTAPADGMVTAIFAGPGQAVSDDYAMASFWPSASRLQAQLYAPSSVLGFVRKGQEVRLRLQAYPYQKFGWVRGRVHQIAMAPTQPQELSTLPLALRSHTEPLYRISVDLPPSLKGPDGRALVLQPGMQLQADVLLEKRTLIEWLFEPLLGWRKR